MDQQQQQQEQHQEAPAPAPAPAPPQQSPEPPLPSPDPDPDDSTVSGPAAAALLMRFSHFLTVVLHGLIFHRGIYPPQTFLLTRAYNLAVHQSRHPGVCSWVDDAVEAVIDQLYAGAVRSIVVSMHADKSLGVLERWVFDVASFPAWDLFPGEELGEDEEDEEGGQGQEGQEGEEGDGDMVVVDDDGNDDDDDEEGEQELPEDDINWTDVNEGLRGALRRIVHAAEGLPKLPRGTTFTVAVVLRGAAPAPIGDPQPWAPSLPALQPPTARSPNQGSSLGGKSTMPIRFVRAGPLFFECWVEQAERPLPQPKLNPVWEKARSSKTASSKATSSEETSSKATSSEETSSKATSSEETSSKATSSNATSPKAALSEGASSTNGAPSS